MGKKTIAAKLLKAPIWVGTFLKLRVVPFFGGVVGRSGRPFPKPCKFNVKGPILGRKRGDHGRTEKGGTTEPMTKAPWPELFSGRSGLAIRTKGAAWSIVWQLGCDKPHE